MLDNGVARDNGPHSRNAPSSQGGGTYHGVLNAVAIKLFPSWMLVSLVDCYNESNHPYPRSLAPPQLSTHPIHPVLHELPPPFSHAPLPPPPSPRAPSVGTYILNTPCPPPNPPSPPLPLPPPQVFLLKAAVNLTATMLDTPEFFWRAPDNLQVRRRRREEGGGRGVVNTSPN